MNGLLCDTLQQGRFEVLLHGIVKFDPQPDSALLETDGGQLPRLSGITERVSSTGDEELEQGPDRHRGVCPGVPAEGERRRWPRWWWSHRFVWRVRENQKKVRHAFWHLHVFLHHLADVRGQQQASHSSNPSCLDLVGLLDTIRVWLQPLQQGSLQL